MIRGTQRVISTPDSIDLKASIHNRFDVEVVDSLTGEVKQTAQALNVICSGLWNRLFSPATYFNYIFYGGGAGTPSVSDTSLFSHIGYGEISKATYGVDYSTGVYYRKGSIQLAAATAAGKTISEVGIAYGTATNSLCTHAMLKDMNGNPISIEKTDTDVINIYATVFIHFDRLGYDNKTIFLLQNDNYGSGSNAGSDLFSWISGAYHSTPSVAWWCPYDTLTYESGYYSNCPVPTTAIRTKVTYSADAANKRVTLQFGRLEASAGNYAQGLTHVAVGGPYYSSDDDTRTWRFVPAFLIYPGGSSHPYSVVENEAVGTGDGSTKDFALDFAFPHNARVYIDGVETSEFSLDCAPNQTNWVRYMRGVHPLSREGALIPLPQLGDDFYGGRTVRFYNPMWEMGISSIGVQYGSKTDTQFSTSQDGETWETLNLAPTTTASPWVYPIPPEYSHNRFWKMTGSSSGNAVTVYSVGPPEGFSGKCLHFSNPPPEGSIITADYRCDCFAKDANHVLDMSVTIQFGEYTESQ